MSIPHVRLAALVLVLSLTAEVRAAPVPVPPARGGRLWQRASLNLHQAARQARQIAANRQLGRPARVARVARAITASLGLFRPRPVLLYQGAFDPVHRGHLTNLRAALAAVQNVGEVFVVPTSDHPGKNPVPHPHRVAMMRAALADVKLPRGVKVTVVDDARLARLDAGGFDDLTGMIHSRRPGAPLYILTGADAFGRAAEQGLVALARRWGYRYAVTPRAGYELPARLPAGVEVTSMAGGKESSTRIRRQLSRGLPATDALPSTLSYIEQHGLYGAGRRRP